MRFSLLAVVLLVGCPDAHSASRDVPSDVPSADVRRDTLGFDACIAPVGPRRGVSDEMATCIGIARPACAACHLVGGGYELRPAAGVPPAGVDLTIPVACGLCR